MTLRWSDRVQPILDLWISSFLLLFFELVVLRWIPSNVRLVAYFSNVILISCFLGFGVGCLVRDRKDLFPYFPFLLLALVSACRFLSRISINNPYEAVEGFFTASGQISWFYVIPFLFLLNAFAFVCIGQKVARLLDSFPPLLGYSLNVLGSLVGTLAFAAMSFRSFTPLVWFFLCFLLTAWLLRDRKGLLLGSVAIFSLSAWIIGASQRNSLWSPYNKIGVLAYPPAETRTYGIVANSDIHQIVLDLSPRWVSKYADLRSWQESYDFPYRVLGRRPQNVLVLGAGAGNDVAAALRNGAAQVDAVEIDPIILRLGRLLHAEHPYDDPRVTAHVDDARSFLRHPARLYDVVAFGWLDSHRLFANLSNIRQDNFVYTLQSIQQARAALSDDGILCLSFYSAKPWIASKLFRLIESAFGHAPSVFARAEGGYGKAGTMFLISRNPTLQIKDSWPGMLNLTESIHSSGPVPMPTDDWPYLYYRDKTLAHEYAVTILMLTVLSALLVWAALPKGNMFGDGMPHFFFLGAAFMLLEVKNLTTLALVYGSTWVVTSVVISAVLLMVLLSNFLVGRYPRLPEEWMWILLLASVVGVYFVPPDILSGQRWGSLAPTVLTSSTFLFAGFVFARSFSRTPVPSRALGANILGAVIGGLTEYLSLPLGIRSLLLIALLFYGAAWVLSDRKSLPLTASQ
jgi:spermidine synthase